MENKQTPNLGNLMLDLETMGNKSNSAIVSIGAVEFDLNTGKVGRRFYQTIDLQSSLDHGLIVNGSTIYWWLKQTERARREISCGGDDLNSVLSKFNRFMAELGNFKLWGNGSRFDIGILEDSYVKCGYNEMPWNFRNEMDVRTLVAFAPEIKQGLPFLGTEHNPIDDCLHQISYCAATWREINKKLT